MSLQLRDIVSILQEINTAQIDESATTYPAFIRWWKVHCHEFPDCLKSILATGFTAGHRQRTSMKTIKEEIEKAVTDAMEYEFERITKEDD